jgi:hypothetical protein
VLQASCARARRWRASAATSSRCCSRTAAPSSRRRGDPAARRRAVVAVRVGRQGLPGRRLVGVVAITRLAPSLSAVLSRPTPRASPPRSRAATASSPSTTRHLAVHAPDEPRVAEAHQRRARRGRLHAALPADPADRGPRDAARRASRRCCA